MKRTLRITSMAVGVLVALYAVAMVVAYTGWKGAAAKAWPLELGTLEELSARYPTRVASADALQLAALARPLGMDFAERKSGQDAVKEATAAFVDGEWAKGVAAIGEAPRPVAEFIAGHAAEIDAVTVHLARSRDLSWAMNVENGFAEPPPPSLPAHLQLSKLLVARALIRAREGDAHAWDDLHAAHLLNRSLEPRPELVSQVISLGIARMINAAAWKLPAPAPAWLKELDVDRRRPLLRAMQVDTWLLWRTGREHRYQPYMLLSLWNLAQLQRESALGISRVTSCGFDGSAFSEQQMSAIPRWNFIAQVASPNIGQLWTRTLRFEAEREGTANALRVRSGTPIDASSRCTDGAWRYDGGRLAFSAAIADTSKAAMPLVMQVAAE